VYVQSPGAERDTRGDTASDTVFAATLADQIDGTMTDARTYRHGDERRIDVATSGR